MTHHLIDGETGETYCYDGMTAPREAQHIGCIVWLHEADTVCLDCSDAHKAQTGFEPMLCELPASEVAR